jgi:hypothetical protein
MEGLKGTTKFYKDQIDVDSGAGMEEGEYLRAISSTRAQFMRAENLVIPFYQDDGTYDPIYLSVDDQVPLWVANGSRGDFDLAADLTVPFYVAAGTADNIALKATLHGY